MDKLAFERGSPEVLALSARQAIEQVRDQAMFLVDSGGRVASWNEGVGLILGWQAPDWIGQPLQVTYTEEDVAAGVPQAQLRRAAAEGRAGGQRWMRRRNGEHFLAWGEMARLLDASGALLGYLQVLRDCSVSAPPAGPSQDQLLATVSHELRTPLSAILGWAHVLERGAADPATLQQGLAAIARNARRQVQLIDDLLDAGRTAPRPLPGDAAARLDGVQVLLVDDEPDLRAATARVLQDAGAQVLVAANAGEGLDLLRRARPAVILSDIGMPTVDGHALMRSVRALPQEEGGRTPAAAYTARARPEDRQRALDAGYQVHLAKPMLPAALVQALAQLVQQGPVGPA